MESGPSIVASSTFNLPISVLPDVNLHIFSVMHIFISV